MKIHVFTFNSFQENTYIIFDETKKAIIIDPGMMDEGEEDQFIDFIEKNNLTPISIINTHCHIDHILGVKFLMEKYKIPFYAHKNEIAMIERSSSVSLMYGIPFQGCPLPDKYIDESSELFLGEEKLEFLFVPGHSPGHLAIVVSSLKTVIAGDVLFKGSVGRVDLPGCNPLDLVESIQKKMYMLPNEYSVLPGHGEFTTIGEEKVSNYFVSESIVRL